MLPRPLVVPTETKRPSGGSAAPRQSLPQQATDPPFRTPQVYGPPTQTGAKERALGAVSVSASSLVVASVGGRAATGTVVGSS